MPKKGEFKCSICGRDFRMPAHLGRHMATLHGRPSRRPHRAKRGRPAGAARQTTGGNLAAVVREIQTYRDGLSAQHAELESQVAKLDAVLAALGGRAPAKPRAARRGPRGPKFRAGSLKTYVERVLRSAGGPMTVKNITAAVRRVGYKTRNKTLAKSVGNAVADMPNVARVSRGLFRLK